MAKEKTYIANNIETADDKSKYDAQVKNLFKDKNILSMVLKYTMPEFFDCDRELIKGCIEGEPEIGTVPVHPGQTNLQAIHGMSTEDMVNNEGKVTYDIRFFVILPNGNRVKIIVDIEAQQKYYPGYDLVTRGVFYGARMLSAQLDTEFSTDNYDNIKKVYSIWICMNTPKNAENTITEYSIKPTYRYGNFSGNARYDLLSVVMVCLGKNEQEGNELHNMLNVLLSDKMSAAEKENILETKYNIPMSQDLKEGFRIMCNLSESIEERGIEKGIEKGFDKGFDKGIKIFILDNLDEGKSKDIIIGKLKKNFELSTETAIAYYEKYAIEKA